MSAYVHVRCMCAHRKHAGQCPNRACGCTVYRSAAALLPKVPRVVRGAVVRELPGATR